MFTQYPVNEVLGREVNATSNGITGVTDGTGEVELGTGDAAFVDPIRHEIGRKVHGWPTAAEKGVAGRS